MSFASSKITVQLSGLPREKLHALRSQAKAAGMTADAYARQLIEEAVSLEQEARTTTLDALFAPVQKRFRESGMTESELDDLVDAARRRHHRGTSKSLRRKA